MVDIGEVVVFESNVYGVLVVKHAAQGAYRALEDRACNLETSRVNNCWVGAKTEPPQDDPIEGTGQPG